MRETLVGALEAPELQSCKAGGQREACRRWAGEMLLEVPLVAEREYLPGSGKAFPGKRCRGAGSAYRRSPEKRRQAVQTEEPGTSMWQPCTGPSSAMYVCGRTVQSHCQSGAPPSPAATKLQKNAICSASGF